jgi:hypothetical protein
MWTWNLPNTKQECITWPWRSASHECITIIPRFMDLLQLILLQLVNKFIVVTKLWHPSPYSQNPSTVPYPEPIYEVPIFTTHFSNVTLSYSSLIYTYISQVVSFPEVLLQKLSIHFLFSPCILYELVIHCKPSFGRPSTWEINLEC